MLYKKHVGIFWLPLSFLPIIDYIKNWFVTSSQLRIVILDWEMISASLITGFFLSIACAAQSCHYYSNSYLERAVDPCHHSPLSQSVNFVGRFADLDTVPRADWSGAGIHFFAVLQSSTAWVEIIFEACSTGCEIYVNVGINCQSKSVELLNETVSNLNISLSGAIGSTIEISVLKRSEDYEMAVTQIQAVGADLSAQSSTPSCSTSTTDMFLNRYSKTNPLKIIFLGDSITAGNFGCADQRCA
jgi:hypothetical protein